MLVIEISFLLSVSCFVHVSSAAEEIECIHGSIVRFQQSKKVRCRCSKGYTGKACDRAIRCKFGDFNEKKRECICHPGYRGRHCDRKHLGVVEGLCDGKNCTSDGSNSTSGGSNPQGLAHEAILAIVISILLVLSLALIALLAWFIRKWWLRRLQRKELKGLNLRAPYTTRTVLSLSPAVVRIANTETDKSSDQNSLLAASSSSQNALLDQNCIM